MKNYFKLLKRYNLLGKNMIFIIGLVFLNFAETLNIQLFTDILDNITSKRVWIFFLGCNTFIVAWNYMIYCYMVGMVEKFKMSHKMALYEKVTYYSINQLNDSSMAKITSSIDSANSMIDNIVRKMPEWIIHLVVSSITSIFLLGRKNFFLLIIVLLEIIPLGTMIFKGKKMTKELSKKRKEISLKMYSIIERLYGYMVIKSFSKEKYEVQNFFNVSHKYQKLSTKKRYYNCKVEATARIMNFVMNLTWAIYALWSFKNGTFSIPEIMLFSKLTGNIINPFYNVSSVINELTELNTNMGIANEILSGETEYDGKIQLEEFNSMIEFKGVSFSYKDSSDILNNLNFKIPKGCKVGIYGESGAGKSSLVNLIMRFYQCTSGSILIDGVNINEFTNESLRSHIGIINQEIFLFSNMTIRENIMYGKQNCTEVEMIEAAKKACCHDFISKLPNGYNSYVGINGVKLSGGERQRIAIARLFLLNPDILILDEATSKLDNMSELLVKEAIEKLSEDKTVISIAHRFSTIENSDLLIGIQDHTIKEMGTKEELDKMGTLFHSLRYCEL